MEVILGYALNVLIFAAVLSIIVVVHEFGHLVAAKRFGVYCKEFAVGMGPVIFKKQSMKSETAYSIRALPIGGFVAMAGEPGEQGMDDVPLEKTINGIARWKRLIIMLAGVFMNIVLAFVVFFGIFQVHGIVQTPKPILQEVVKDSAAQKAGMLANDEIIKLVFKDGTVVVPKSSNDVVLGITSFSGEEVEVTVKRNNQEEKLTLTPTYDEASKTYKLGVYFVPGELKRVSFLDTIGYTFSYIVNMVVQLVTVLGWLVRGKGLNNVGGPIAIFQQTAKVQVYGMTYFWELIGALSVSLAVMNLLPIPVMDGGRALITVVEMIIRRPIPKKLENFVMVLGFAMMVAIMIVFIFLDIKRL